ncbi:HNH endonuclease [Myxococcota bacterium]|nr:HNH endonuclease [Myxococcota bacterium]
MSYNNDELNWVYDRTGGYCFYCGIKLAFVNYGKVGNRGCWEVDHFIPLASNGAHQPYNWVPACVDCNTRKSNLLPWHFMPDRFSQGERDPENYL